MDLSSRVGNNLELSDSYPCAADAAAGAYDMPRGESRYAVGERAAHRPDLVLADISVERRVLRPVVAIVLETADQSLFANESS